MRDKIEIYNLCDSSDYDAKSKEVISKILEIIEESGMNFFDAKNLPLELDRAIWYSSIGLEGNTPFKPYSKFKGRKSDSL